LLGVYLVRYNHGLRMTTGKDAMPSTCSNCNGSLSDGKYLSVLHRRKVVASICSVCQDGVLTLKIAISRETVHADYAYEQYLPVSSTRV
jgi:hypothetical protein